MIKTRLESDSVGELSVENEADYDKIDLGDDLVLENIRAAVENGGKVVLKNKTKGIEIPLVSDYSERQRKLLLAGGLLNYTGKNVKK